MRGGLELEGVTHLRDFVKAGGVLITLGSSSELPIYFGLAPGVSIVETPDLWARGGVYRTVVSEPTSAIANGYDSELGVAFGRAPVFRVGTRAGGGRGPGAGAGGAADAAAPPRVILRFSPDVGKLLISGGLMNGEALAGAPALVDARLGDGHIVMFSFDPFHRAFSTGSYSLVFNTIMNFDHLDVGDGHETAGPQ